VRQNKLEFVPGKLFKDSPKIRQAEAYPSGAPLLRLLIPCSKIPDKRTLKCTAIRQYHLAGVNA